MKNDQIICCAAYGRYKPESGLEFITMGAYRGLSPAEKEPWDTDVSVIPFYMVAHAITDAEVSDELRCLKNFPK